MRSAHGRLNLIAGYMCRGRDVLLAANKGGYAFAVDPLSGETLWATAVGIPSPVLCICRALQQMYRPETFEYLLS